MLIEALRAVLALTILLVAFRGLKTAGWQLGRIVLCLLAVAVMSSEALSSISVAAIADTDFGGMREVPYLTMAVAILIMWFAPKWFTIEKDLSA